MRRDRGLDDRSAGGAVSVDEPVTGAGYAWSMLLVRVEAEYREMPGLHLTLSQAARLFGMPTGMTRLVLDHLHHASVLRLGPDGTYSLEP